MGFTLNIITLLALALAVGIVIDDAIVVLENIFRFIEEKRLHAVRRRRSTATKEIGLAVLATTLSLIAVFLPVAFMGGIVGRFLNSLRPHDGVRDRRLAARVASRSRRCWPRAGCSATRAEGGEARATRRAQSSTRASTARSSASTCDLLALVMAHRWVVVVARGRSRPRLDASRSSRRCRRASCPSTTRRSSRSRVRAPEGTSLDATRPHRASASPRERPAAARRRLHAAHRRRRRQKTPNLAHDLREARRRPSKRKLEPDRAHGHASARRSSRSTPTRSCASASPYVNAFSAAADDGRDPVRRSAGPDLDEARADLRADAHGEAAEGARRGRRRLVAHRRQARARRRRRPREAADLGVGVADIAGTLRVLVGGEKVSTYDEGGEQYDVHLRARRASTARDSDGARALRRAVATLGAGAARATSSTLRHGDGPVARSTA